MFLVSNPLPVTIPTSVEEVLYHTSITTKCTTLQHDNASERNFFMLIFLIRVDFKTCGDVFLFNKQWILILFDQITLANKKKSLFSKRARNLYELWSGMMSRTRCCLQIFPKLNSFPVIICWNFQNCTFSRSRYFFNNTDLCPWLKILS